MKHDGVLFQVAFIKPYQVQAVSVAIGLDDCDGGIVGNKGQVSEPCLHFVTFVVAE